MFAATPQFEAALQIVRTLRASGYEAYFAGGCVRDLLLGRQPMDYDVATSATPDAVLDMFPRTFAVGAHFGVVLVCAANNDAVGQRDVTEVATFRADGVYSDGRHPDAVRYTTSAREDVQRRDFTINGLLLDPTRLDLGLSKKPGAPGLDFETWDRTEADPSTRLPGGLAEDDSAKLGALRPAIIDHVGGVADLDAGVVRAIGRAELRFEEDHLRMLRAVRFAARFGFAIEPQTATAIRGLAAKIHAVSRERVRDELTKMLTEGRARSAFELLDATGLLAEVLPEVARMKGVAQPPQFHPEGDVWMHTLMLLEQLEADCPLTLAWGALLHDVGKPPTFRVADRIRFDGHVEVGVAMGAEICRRFRFSNDEARQIVELIENHMRFASAPKMKESTLKRFFRLESFDQHLALHRMDCMASHGGLENWEFVRERFGAMPEETVRPKPLVTGRELIAAGYRPGPQFKEMLHAVEDAQLEGQIATAEDAMQLIGKLFAPPQA